MAATTRMVMSVLQGMCVLLSCTAVQPSRPHIVVIVADDLGWNDVGFHGSVQIPTPNIDALAYGGIILNNYYVSPICTPSRSALMTGKYPIHTGMQHDVIYGNQPYGLPLSHKLLPEYLKDLGYVNHMVGKWHLGMFRKEYTPTYRGFDSHFGYWTGHEDYYDHTSVQGTHWGFDMRRNMSLAWDTFGHYTTDLFTSETVDIIQSHDLSRPLFLYLAHLAVHSANPYSPLQAPEEVVDKFSYIKDKNRRQFAGMVTKMDDSVGNVVAAMWRKRMLNNSIIVLTTDNGGPAAGFNLNAASNWPLRGVKNTLWEGGVRGIGVIWSPFLKKTQRVSGHLLQIEDWLPTLYSAAGGSPTDLIDMDGKDAWKCLSNDGPPVRNNLLHNIDDEWGVVAVRFQEYKFVNGSTYGGAWDGWYGPSGRKLDTSQETKHNHKSYNATLVYNSLVAKSLTAIGHPITADIHNLRKSAEVNCGPHPPNATACKPLIKPCLFSIQADPCEYNNIAEDNAFMMSRMIELVSAYKSTAVPPGNQPEASAADPKYWGYAWVNWKDILEDF